MEKFFPPKKIIITGNPVRSEILQPEINRTEAFKFFDLDETKFTVLVIGGSLGARSINEAMANSVKRLTENGIQVIWQTGKGNAENAQHAALEAGVENVKVHEFIQRMDLAYACADLVVSRAGAIAVSELCLVKKPSILIPFPFAAEDHQTSNAKALSEKGAAMLIRDDQARDKLGLEILNLYSDEQKRNEMKAQIAAFARPAAAELIVDEIFKLIKA
jgi:UDP-N-acetylglucosamine--N-acetylmuramyl-(pentapeptide) pyrophosphoryl-undecaprenol N-acetylglucosamine transferase